MRGLIGFSCCAFFAAAAQQDAVLAEAQAIVARYPNDPQALLKLGSLYDRLGQFENAAPILQRAVKAAPKLAAARLELAVCLARLHRYREASSALEGVPPPEGGPQLLLYHRLKASIASGNGGHATAAAEMEKAVQLDPQNRDLLIATAVAQVRAGLLDGALASAQIAQGIQDTAALENLIGDIQEKRGDSLAAVHSYQAAIQLAPDNEEYRLSLGLELLRHHTFEPAILVLEQAAKQFPASLKTQVALALGYFLVNRDKDATEVLLTAMRLESGREFVLNYLGDLLVEQGEIPDGSVVKQVCGDAQSHPDSGRAQAVCGGLLLRLQIDRGDTTQHAEMLARLRKAVRLSPQDPAGRCQLGKALELDQDWQNARKEMEECVRLRPDSTEWHYRLARIYLRLGLPDLAKEQDRLRAAADEKLASASQQRYATLSRFLYALESK